MAFDHFIPTENLMKISFTKDIVTLPRLFMAVSMNYSEFVIV